MNDYFYLIHIQYLGFRFHGWQKQPNVKTVHLMVDKTVAFVLKHDKFRTLGSSRTDSKVSALHAAFELFVKEPIDMDWFLAEFNSNLPSDIRALKIEEVAENFNIINTPKLKEYMYLFTFGEKPHPFSSAIMTYFKSDLDIELMKEGARVFEGSHNFVQYCTKPSANTHFTRTIEFSKIEENHEFTASFFPEKSFQFILKSKGFMRYQVRLMMAQLVCLGRGEIDLDQLKASLTGENTDHLKEIAPGSGLTLKNIEFEF